MAIAGIEGLAQGFMQGMALKRQNDRQDVLDAQNLEKFGMDKERFATQQAASAFDLQNAQTNAANAATDRTRTLGIQAKGDAILANMQKLWSLGDNAEAIHSEVEKLHQANGEQGAYKRDAAGKIITNKSGVATWVNKDGSEHEVDAKGAKMSYWMAANPNEAAKNQLENDNTIAKEGRDVTNSILKGAPKIASDERISRANNASKERQITLQLQYRTKQEKDAAISAFSPYISSARQILRNNKLSAEDLHNMKRDLTKDGFIQEGIRSFNAANATKKLTPEQIKAAQKEVTSLADALYGAAGATDATTSGTDTYDSKSQGKLVPIGLEGEAGAIELNDRQPVSVEKPSSSAAQPASPVSPSPYKGKGIFGLDINQRIKNYVTGQN